MTAPSPAAGPGTPEPFRTPGRPGIWGALAGLVATGLGLGVAQLLAGLVGPGAAPLIAVGDAFVDLTPPWLKTFATETFGTADKAVLLLGAGAVLAGLGALAGVLGIRRERTGVVLVVALAVVAATAAATRPDATLFSVVPSIAGGIAGMYGLRYLLPRVRIAAFPVGEPVGQDRRSVLRALGLTAGAGALTGLAGWLLGTGSRAAEDSRESVALPSTTDTAPAAPPDAAELGVDPTGTLRDFQVAVDGVTPFRVPNGEFYRIDTALVVPRRRAEDWSLRIHGMVRNEVTLTWPQLVASALVERDVTLTCVSNDVGGGLAGNARWLGLPIATLLERAQPAAGADMVLSTSVDGWTAGTPLEALTDGRDALLAIGMNGEPLPVEHGFPVRLVVPGLYGYVSATKWVVDLEVTRFDRAEGYWTPRGWSARGPVKTASRIDVPRDHEGVRAGKVTVAGVAWAQHRGIVAVEVQVDGGDWRRARLAGVPSVDTWRQWSLDWEAAPGDHVLQVRAVDADGVTQTQEVAPPAPDGATGWHSIRVQVA